MAHVGSLHGTHGFQDRVSDLLPHGRVPACLRKPRDLHEGHGSFVVLVLQERAHEFEGVKHADTALTYVSKYFTKDGMPNTLRCESVSEVSKFKYVVKVPLGRPRCLRLLASPHVGGEHPRPRPSPLGLRCVAVLSSPCYRRPGARRPSLALSARQRGLARGRISI